MMWFFTALAAQVILGTSSVFDKMLLKRGFFDPLVYTFWFGMLGLFAFFLLPFGRPEISAYVMTIALFAGVLFVFAMQLLFMALAKGEALPTLLLIGALSPVVTLALGAAVLSDGIGVSDIIGFFFLVCGSAVMVFTAKEKKIRLVTLSFAAASAFLFGFSNVLTKLVFDYSSFVAGFLWIKLGGVFLVLLFLFVPSFRTRIVNSHSEHKAQNRTLYFANRAYAAAGSVLVYIAISLAHPALVDAMQSFRYVVIFIAAWFFLKEFSRGFVLFGKIGATLIVAFGLLWLGMGEYAHALPVDSNRQITWGLTFSQKMSRGFGLDWQKNITAIMEELHPKKVRLIAYWDEIEKEKGVYNFADTDWLMDEAARSGAEAVLAVGMKAPRWPECHIPGWAQTLSMEERETVLREYMSKVVERYRLHPGLVVWQVENEPYLAFGECPERGENFLEKEIALVKSLDSTHPVLTTDGGEFGRWYKAAKAGDMFGTTMYRRVYPKVIGPMFGAIEYPLAPSFFKLKEKVVRSLLGNYKKPFLVIELQAEPWSEKPVADMTAADLEKNFSPAYFKETIAYAKETGFPEYYLWGSEWWFWLKEKGDSRYWDIAKALLK